MPLWSHQSREVRFTVRPDSRLRWLQRLARGGGLGRRPAFPSRGGAAVPPVPASLPRRRRLAGRSRALRADDAALAAQLSACRRVSSSGPAPRAAARASSALRRDRALRRRCARLRQVPPAHRPPSVVALSPRCPGGPLSGRLRRAFVSRSWSGAPRRLLGRRPFSPSVFSFSSLFSGAPRVPARGVTGRPPGPARRTAPSPALRPLVALHHRRGREVAWIAVGVVPINVNFILAPPTRAVTARASAATGRPAGRRRGRSSCRRGRRPGRARLCRGGFSAQPDPGGVQRPDRGVAPGASLVGLDVFGSGRVTAGPFLQAISCGRTDHVTCYGRSAPTRSRT